MKTINIILSLLTLVLLTGCSQVDKASQPNPVEETIPVNYNENQAVVESKNEINPISQETKKVTEKPRGETKVVRINQPRVNHSVGKEDRKLYISKNSGVPKGKQSSIPVDKENSKTSTIVKEKETVVSTNTAPSIPDANNDGECNDVKGNRGSEGWFYHIPDGASYNVTKAEETFCTTKQAEQAGYNKPSK